MTNMDTSERWAKNREIAGLLGWTTFSVSKHGVIVGIAPNGWATSLPDFYGSLDAAFAVLPKDTHITIEPRRVQRQMTYFVTLMNPDAETTALSYGEGTDRQEAAANALLAWATAEKTTP